MSESIQFIYFDVGGVAMLDFSKNNKWEELLDDIQMPRDVRRSFGELFMAKIDQFYQGAADVDDMVEVMQGDYMCKLPDSYSLVADIVARFEQNGQLGDIVQDLADSRSMGLLTNMYSGMLDQIHERRILPSVNWDVVVDSSEVGMMKPQAEIYEYATQAAGVSRENILFVENTPVYVEAARNFGWQTFLYDPLNLEYSNTALKEYLR